MFSVLSSGHNIHTRLWFYHPCFNITSVTALPYADCTKLSQLILAL